MATTRRPRRPRQGVSQRSAPGLDVLVIDDDAIFLRIATPTLTRLGCRPRLAQSVEAAQRQLLDGAPISVILLDLIMPDAAQDGVAFLEWFRGHPAVQLARVPPAGSYRQRSQAACSQTSRRRSSRG